MAVRAFGDGRVTDLINDSLCGETAYKEAVALWWNCMCRHLSHHVRLQTIPKLKNERNKHNALNRTGDTVSSGLEIR